MSLPAEKPPVPYGRLSRRDVKMAVIRCLKQSTARKREDALVQLVGALVDRIEENEEIIAAGSPPGDGPRRLEPDDSGSLNEKSSP